MKDPSFTVIPVPGDGAEDVVVATHGPDEGAVFTGTEDGSIYRISHDARKVERIAHTGGRPLGIEIDLDGRLLVCDAYRGVLRVDARTGAVEQVTDSIDGQRMLFCDNAAVASDGTIWFSDSSRKFTLEHWKKDLVTNSRTGRLVRLGTDGVAEVVLDDLAFANGVALSAAEDYVAVAETAARSVVRRWLTGERAGSRDYLVQDLPGYPDNIARGSDDLIWVSLASPKVPLLERIQGSPSWLRQQAARIPERLQPQPKRWVRAQAYSDNGALVHDVQVETADYHLVTGVRELDGRLWLGSFMEPALAVLTL